MGCGDDQGMESLSSEGTLKELGMCSLAKHKLREDTIVSINTSPQREKCYLC